MKLRILFSILVTLLILAPGLLRAVENDPQNPLPKDKAMHLGVSAAAQTACTAVGRLVSHSKWGSQLTCFVSVNAIGAVKEATDPYRGGTRDETDIYANLVGSGFSFVVMSIAF